MVNKVKMCTGVNKTRISSGRENISLCKYPQMLFYKFNCVLLIVIFIFSEFCVPVTSTFNFYMNTDEVKRLLGKKSLHYYFYC